MKTFRGDLIITYLKTTTLNTLFGDRIYFGVPGSIKDGLTLYIRAFDTPKWINSFVRIEFTVYWPANTSSQALFNAVWSIRDELVEVCWTHRKAKINDFGWYSINHIEEWPQIWPDRDMNNLPIVKKDFLFYYNWNG